MKMFTTMGLLIAMMVLLTGCVTEHKAVGMANGIDGFKLEVVGSGQTGAMPFPNLWLANDVFSYASAPAIMKDEKTQVVFTVVKRRSFFGSLFGVDDASTSMSYIGAPSESADDTIKRINVLTSVLNKAVNSTVPITSNITTK